MRWWMAVALFVLSACGSRSAPASLASPAPLPATVAPAAAVAPDSKATATAHYDAARGWRDDGELGLAIEEARQSLAAYPYPNPAQNFLSDLIPKATIAARAAMAPTETSVPQAAAPPRVASPPPPLPVAPALAPSGGGSSGCGSRGGPGYRLPNGKCAGRR
jgi:hypothetical protein